MRTLSKSVWMFFLALSLNPLAHSLDVVSDPTYEIPVASIVQLKEFSGPKNIPIKVVESYIGSAAGVSRVYITAGGLEEPSETWQLPTNFTEIKSIQQAKHNDENTASLIISGWQSIARDDGSFDSREVVVKIEIRFVGEGDELTPDKVLKFLLPPLRFP